MLLMRKNNEKCQKKNKRCLVKNYLIFFENNVFQSQENQELSIQIIK